jgi:putative selenate reductase
MRPVSFGALVERMLQESGEFGSVFGVRKNKFFTYTNEGFNIFGKQISSAIGPAAGPNTQLAPNIMAAYLAGSRVIELKTVQIIDGEDLRKAVARPCINAADEGYNVEWSTELTVPQAMDEYIKAWFLLHIAAKEFALENSSIPDCDFLFNMSVGYSYDGIISPKIDTYLNGLTDASGTDIW